MAKFNSELNIWESRKVPYPHSKNVFFGEILFDFCDATPDRVLQFHHEEKKSLTCKELKHSSIAIAQNLVDIGVKPDDVITIICSNSNFVTSFIHGSVLMGAIIHPLSNKLSADTIRHLVKQTSPRMIVCDADVLSKVIKATEIMSNLRIFVTGDEKGSIFFFFGKIILF